MIEVADLPLSSILTLSSLEEYSGMTVSLIAQSDATAQSLSWHHLTCLNFGSYINKCLFMKSAPKITDSFSPLMTRKGCSVFLPKTETDML